MVLKTDHFSTEDSMFALMNKHYCCNFLLMVALLGIVGHSQIQGAHDSGSHVIEITATDLFLDHNWNSTKVSVLGIRLGMTREEALEQLRYYKFHLEDSDPGPQKICRQAMCDVHNSLGVYSAMVVFFDPSNHVVEIHVERIPADAGVSVRKAAITNRFKGSTYSLFNNYSTALRKRLLGLESAVDSDPTYPDIKSYKYERLGVKLTITANRYGGEKESDLSVAFMSPLSMHRQSAP